MCISDIGYTLVPDSVTNSNEFLPEPSKRDQSSVQ